MRFSVLGLVSLSDGVETVVLPPSKSTSLLAALLLRPNQVVSAEYLQSVVWESSPPLTAKATLQTYILRLRRLFRSLGHAGCVIETVPGGYRFPATAANLDLVEFRQLVVQASRAADPYTELALLCRALRLWQGPPLGNIRSEPLRRDDLPWLTEEWLQAAERRFDLELELGRHREVTAELRAAAREHLGYERFWEQLVESLYRSGRQADALSEYSNVKHYLREELGIDPGPGLQQLELAILRGEQLAARGPVAPARAASGDPGARFTGRTAEIEALRSWLAVDRPAPLVVISGPPGIGKTALAVYVAQSSLGTFAGPGQVIRMTGPDGGPRPAAELAAELPPEAPVTGGPARRLLVFDDVTDADKVRPLLPADPSAAVIVTSRSSLAGLATRRGGIVLRLGALDPADSVRLLGAALGDRAPADPVVTMAAAEACDHLPAALLLAAARLAGGEPTDGPSSVAALRANPARWLAGAGDPSVSVGARFDAYLSTLDDRLVEALHAVARAPAAELSTSDVGHLLAEPPGRAEEILEDLLDASLLEIGPSGGYRMYPLLRSFAAAGLMTVSKSIGETQ